MPRRKTGRITKLQNHIAELQEKLHRQKGEIAALLKARDDALARIAKLANPLKEEAAS